MLTKIQRVGRFHCSRATLTTRVGSDKFCYLSTSSRQAGGRMKLYFQCSIMKIFYFENWFDVLQQDQALDQELKQAYPMTISTTQSHFL